MREDTKNNHEKWIAGAKAQLQAQNDELDTSEEQLEGQHE